MSYTPIPLSGRIERLKETYLTLPVPREKDPYHPVKYRCYCSGDRLITLGYLRGFAMHADALTTRLRTSYAEAQELYEAQPVICDDELLLGHLWLPDFTEEEQKEYDKLCDAYAMSPQTLTMRPPRRDHLCMDFEKLLRLGISGLKEEIRRSMDKLELCSNDLYPAMDILKQLEFYRCCLIELDAVSDLAARYSAAALSMAEKTPEPRKSELLRMAQLLTRVPDQPATSFYEAIQSVQFFLSTLFGLYPLGRPDRYLYPYYQQDVENGTLTREFAQELIDNFCLCVSDRVFSRAACGFIVGGYDRNGKLVENDLTYMFITALDHLKLPDPNGALAVNRDTSRELLRYCAEVLSHGTTHPAFYNDEAIISSLRDVYGVAPEDAADYIHSTCAEITLVGKSKGHSTPIYVDLPRLLQEAVQADTYQNFDALFAAFRETVRRHLLGKTERYAMRILEAARVGCEAMRPCTLVDDCIARGKSFYEGGERYTFLQPIFVGFATVTDSLIALSRLIYEDRKLSQQEFLAAVDSDFADHEPLRRFIIRKLPHYGNDDPVADAMAARLADFLKSLFGKRELPLDKYMMPGTFSYISHAHMGAAMGATFDGRKAGYSYSDGCGAVQGRDVNGPTAMIRSLTSWEQKSLLGGMVVNMKFRADGLRGEKADNFLAILHAFLDRGGIELQVNVVDRATLEDARQNPEDHRDLIVRIGGYSDYFTRLNPILQQEIIDRTEY